MNSANVYSNRVADVVNIRVGETFPGSNSNGSK
jgi:hypothetical protein